MSVIVLAPDRSAESAALLAALDAGLGAVQAVRDRDAAFTACLERPRAVLVLDLRGSGPQQASEAARLRRECPAVRTVALVSSGQPAPPDCDAVFPEPFFLEDVVRWCARATVTPMAEGILQDLAAGLCHEIGNPLTSLFLQLELLKADGGSGAASEHLALIEESARRIQSVVRDVAKAAERHPVVARPTGLLPLLDQVRTRVAEHSGGLALRVDVSCSDQPLKVDADLLSGALADVWEYLLAAGDARDRLAVAAGSRDSRTLVIRHQAHVPRLPPDAAGRLFTPLWARQALGLPEGISLTSARNAFLRHQGDLRARVQPGGILLVDALLPREAQSTIEFEA